MSKPMKRTRHGLPLRPEDWTDQELRSAHVAYTHHGMRTLWASVGERIYNQRYARRKGQAA